MPYTDPLDPDFIVSYRYSDLDALIELFGHLRAANPASRVEFQTADQLTDAMTTRGILSRWAVWTGTWRQAPSSRVFSFRWLRSTSGTKKEAPTSRS